MKEEPYVKIVRRSCQISETLWNEIKDAQQNLNANEQKKKSGLKKKSWSFLEASEKLGAYLKSKRKKSLIDEKV